MRRWGATAFCWVSAALFAWACSSPSTKPPVVDLYGDDAGTAGARDAYAASDGNARPDASAEAGPDDPYYECQPADAPQGPCPCIFTAPAGGSALLACAAESCDDVPTDTRACTRTGHLIVLSYCPASADAIPYCDAGTHPLPPR